MNRILCTLAAAAAMATPAMAGTKVSDEKAREVMAPYLTTTTVCMAEGMFECHTWMYPDGRLVQFSYDNRAGAGDGNDFYGFRVIEGVWWVEEENGGYNLCRHVGQGPIRCAPQPPRKIGDTWELKHTEGGLKGVTEHFTLIDGHR